MPVYNPPDQILFSPVTNFYKGKAIRQQLAAGKIDLDLKKKKLKQADEKFDLEKKRVKLSEKQVGLQEEAYDLNREKFENEVGKDVASKASFDIYSITQEVNELFEKGGKTPEAEAESLELAAARFTEYAGSLPDGESKNKLLEMLEGGVTTEEYQAILPVAERNAKYYGHTKDGKLTTVAKGADVLDAEGNLIYQNIDEGGSGRQRDDEIRDATAILEGMGVPDAKNEAIKIVDGLVKYVPDAAGGVLYRIDTTKGTAEEVNIDTGVDRGDRPVVDPQETLWSLAEDATGIIKTITAGASQVSGALGGPIAEEVVSARQKFKASENSVIRAFSLNPRYPVAEQKRIKENIAIGPKFLDSKSLMHSRMRAIDSFLRQELALAEFESRRPGIDRSAKAKEEQLINAISGFLDGLGVPQGSGSGIRIISREPAGE